MTVDGTGDGAGIIQRPYEQAENQRWLVTHLGDGVYRLEAMHCGVNQTDSRVLAGERDNHGEEPALIQEVWTGEEYQHWRLHRNPDGSYRLESVDGDTVVTVEDGDAAGSRVIASSAETADSHSWRFEPATYGAVVR